MPLSSSIVGASTDGLTHDVDARWIMSYAAGLGDENPRYRDTGAGVVIAHPLFPVCLEWPVILSTRGLPGSESMTREESARGVHAAHDLHIERPIRAGDRLTTRATVVRLASVRPGAAQTMRLDTVDAEGRLVCRTWQVGISRGVAVSGGDREIESPPPPPTVEGPSGGGARFEIPVGALAAHVYTECARIWNPIHTDRAVALAAGLPDIILHGTATLALAVSRLVEAHLGGDPARVRRIGGRFSAMVLMPSRLTLEVDGYGAGVIAFSVRTDRGELAFSGGYLCFD